MTREEFRQSTQQAAPPAKLTVPLQALWWDRKGDWARAHGLVDELETGDGMAVHAYLHRKEGNEANSNYWYERAGREHYRPQLDEEWSALVDALLARA